jgi:hypothetical protein
LGGGNGRFRPIYPRHDTDEQEITLDAVGSGIVKCKIVVYCAEFANWPILLCYDNKKCIVYACSILALTIQVQGTNRQMSNTNSQVPIPMRPLPANASEAIHDSLIQRGFKRQSLIANYAFSNQQGAQIKTNLLAFAHETFRGPDYTGLTVFSPANGISDEQLARTLAQSGAPFHLIHRYQTERFSFWFTNARLKDSPEQVEARKVAEDIEYSRLPQLIESYRADIQPQRIVDVKQGRDSFRHFADAGPFQLGLWAIEVTGDRLVQHFGRAVATLRQQQVHLADIPDLSTQLLGATILAHTGAFGANFQQSDASLDSLLTRAANDFPNYFSTSIFERWHQPALNAYGILTELSYANFSPELLTQLYREAYPDVSQRRELGRYDTPLYFTRRIWETLPIDYLPPEMRIIADMTCGWGSFLISGHERLSRMIDMEERSLREHIYGNDNEPFAAKLAGLGLLISTLRDRWHISNQDALQWRLPEVQPGIIVGNPPFHGSRKAPSEEHVASSGRFERANLFLDRAIDLLAPGGYLAMVMPQSFVASEAAPLLRQKLLERCDLLEIWELPIGVFESARANSLVLFAHKKLETGLSAHPVRIRTVQSRQLDVFKEYGPFTASSLVISQEQWNENSRRSKKSKNTHIFDYPLILPEFDWRKIRLHCDGLLNVATIFTGTITGSSQRRRHIDASDGEPVQWLTGVRNVIQGSFQITYHNPRTLIYPNEFEEPRIDNRQILAGKKVLINALPSSSWGKRVKAVIERQGFFVSDNFIVVAPKETVSHITLEVVAAVVDWKVSNAWLLEHLKHTKFPMPAIKRIPFPPLLEEECTLLTNAVREIESVWSRGEDQPADALQIIDDTLRKAYQLDDETYERLSLIANWDLESPSTLDAPVDPAAQWIITGVVDSVDAESGQITLWLDGFDTLQTVPIVPVMPGWLLRPEAAFRTSIPRSCVRQRTLANNTSWGFFYAQEYVYLSEEEAFAELVHLLDSSD